MPDQAGNTFSHVKPDDSDFEGEGLRDFFLYRDLGIKDVTRHRPLFVRLFRRHGKPENRRAREFQND